MLHLKSPAKVNLHLRVLGKRPDGYHQIATFFHAIDLSDDLVFSVVERGIRLDVQGFPVPGGEDNLAYRAATLLLKYYGVGKGVHISINKRIPVAAGLGGGSSNAATALVALNRLWQLNLSGEELHRHAAELGSDVPFFLTGPAAVGRGRGEILSPAAPVGGIHVVLAVPPIQVTAAWAYSNLNLELTKHVDDISMFQSFIRTNEIEQWAPLMRNDLEPAVIQRYPVIEQIKGELRERGAQGALMSGSGPAVFGLFKEEKAAKGAAEAVKDAGRTVILTRTLSKQAPVDS